MSRSSVARLLALAVIWGASFLFIKVALEGLSPIQIVLGRLTAGAGVLVVVLAVLRQSLPRDAAIWGHLALMAVVANIIPFFLFGWGEERITSGLAGVLNGTTPLFTLAFAVAALPEERLSWGRASGLAIGFAGVVLVVGPWDQNPLTSSIPGQLACLAAAACYGVAFVYTRRFLANRGYPAIVLSTAQLSIGSLFLLVSVPAVAWTPIDLTPAVAASVLALGAFGTGIAYLLFYRLIADAGATSASLVTYLIPVTAVILGVIVLGEPVGWNLFAGAAVVIAGVAITEGRLAALRTLLPARASTYEPPTVDAPPVEMGEDGSGGRLR